LKKTPLLIIPVLTGLAMLACGLPGLATQSRAAPTPTEKISAQASPTSDQAVNSNTQPVATATTASATPVATATPAPTVDPDAAAMACLSGAWEIVDLSSYVIAAIPPEMMEQYKVQYQGTNGKTYLTFTPQGTISLEAEQLELLFKARVSLFTVQLTVSLDGTINGNYTVEGNTLTTTNMNTSGMSASAEAAGQELLAPAQIIAAIPLVQPPFNTAEFQCTGDALQLRIPAYPDSVPPLDFVKVK
jgi:hypothetical protein